MGTKREWDDLFERSEDFRRYVEEKKSKPDATQKLFSGSPSSITEEQFSLRFHLIRRYERTPFYDRFKKLTMQPEVIRTVVALHQLEVFNSVRARREPATEMKLRGAQELILCRFRYFTRRRSPRGESDLFVDPVDESLEGDSAENPYSSSGSSNASLVVDPESVSNQERSDFKLYVYKRGQLELKAVVKCKTVAQSRDLFQVAMYGIPEPSGLLKEERCPVYVLTWDRGSWYYAILEIDGFIEVKRGDLVETSLLSFPEVIAPEHRNPKGSYVIKFTPSFTRGQIRDMFSKWRRELEFHNLYVPDGFHPVGKLFTDGKRKNAPDFIDDSNLSKGKRMFYEGLLKILVGPAVANWDVKRVEKRWIERNVEQDQVDLLRENGVGKNVLRALSNVAKRLDECVNAPVRNDDQRGEKEIQKEDDDDEDDNDEDEEEEEDDDWQADGEH